MPASIAQLRLVSVFVGLEDSQLEPLCLYASVHPYNRGESIMQEGEPLPTCLYAVIHGSIRVTKLAATGKETILRSLNQGELFAAPALFGNGTAPATVIAEEPCEVITVERDALLNAIRITPEIALSMLKVFNQRLQYLHNTVHGLVSERATVRLARYVHYCATEYGVESTPLGDRLKTKLSYYQIARTIGITYEECVRLFKQFHSVLSYQRGGKITVLDWQQLEAIALGE
jgi:CRP-like cAMP-binding protein